MLERKNEVNLKCEKCGEEFESTGQLKKHMRSHDSGKKTKCNECSRMFDEEWKLKAHIKTHLSYSCENCGKNFKSEDVLSKNKLIAHENHKLQ